ncbi:MAG: alkaline phosphatase D family protein [Verrucomicrobiales bacterium]
MIRKITRRLGLKLIGSGTLAGLTGSSNVFAKAASAEGKTSRLDRWHLTPDRVFLGGEFWANPMEDWKLAGGWATCQTSAAKRNLHSLTHQITKNAGTLEMSVRLRLPENAGPKTSGGFRIGVRSELDEVKSNAFAHNGVNFGLRGDQIFSSHTQKALSRKPKGREVLLTLSGVTQGGQFIATVRAHEPDGTLLGEVSHPVQPQYLKGNIALVSQFDGKGNRPGKADTGGCAFTDWQVGGSLIENRPSQKFGPLLWSMYALSNSRSAEGHVLKLSALTGPLRSDEPQEIELWTQPGGQGEWQKTATATLDTDAWIAIFRLPNWDASKETPYELRYHEKLSDGSVKSDTWSGLIKAEPKDRALRFGALTCQNDYAFPYAPVAENLLRLDPDMLYFSGDQLYEAHGGFGIIRDPADPAILNYLRKFYQFGWSFREAMKDRPTLCLPDDHDVFQGNYWGEGGAAMKVKKGGASSEGGYIQPVKMVNVVHKTNVGHHPDPYDATAVKQGMSVYYGDLVWGGVSFAILSDRQFKSGPEHVDTGGGRADHVADPDFDTSVLDKDGLVLLGERQEKFLAEWSNDWREATMKVVLSQTVFANVATHHGGPDGFLKADLDSGGWPQTPRDRAIDLIRASKALHINGDQHLTTLVQYGVKAQRDSNWSFCSPAIAVGYPRWWRPDDMGMDHQNRPAHGHENTGEFIDGLGNKAYVYAVGNPIVPKASHRYQKAHEKGSGFGLVTIDPRKKTYHIESFRFLIDATDGKADNQFPGWPVTLHQDENAGQNRLG